MKSKPSVLAGFAFILATTILFVALRASSSTVNYTYDGAGRLIHADYGSSTNINYIYDNAGNLLVGSAPGPALLVGPLVGGQLTLSWPALPAGLILQRATALGPANWADATVLSQTQSGSLVVATVSVGPSAAFFRLRPGQ
jgi:hypothetical protein